MARRGGTPENLKPFKKGQTGNPNGRPRVLPELKEALKKILEEEQNGIIALDAILMSLRKRAIQGDVRAIQELLDRYYGKAKQDINVTGNMGVAVSITVDSSETEKELKELLNGGAADERLGT